MAKHMCVSELPYKNEHPVSGYLLPVTSREMPRVGRRTLGSRTNRYHRNQNTGHRDEVTRSSGGSRGARITHALDQHPPYGMSRTCTSGPRIGSLLGIATTGPWRRQTATNSWLGGTSSRDGAGLPHIPLNVDRKYGSDPIQGQCCAFGHLRVT